MEEGERAGEQAKGWKDGGGETVSVARRLSPRPVDRAPLRRKSHLSAMSSSRDRVVDPVRGSRHPANM